MAFLLLMNSNQEQFGEMMIDYRKSFANKDNRYSSSVMDMSDAMQQKPGRKGETNPSIPKKVETPDKEETAQSYAQDKEEDLNNYEWVCCCCGELN